MMIDIMDIKRMGRRWNVYDLINCFVIFFGNLYFEKIFVSYLAKPRVHVNGFEGILSIHFPLAISWVYLNFLYTCGMAVYFYWLLRV